MKDDPHPYQTNYENSDVPTKAHIIYFIEGGLGQQKLCPAKDLQDVLREFLNGGRWRLGTYPAAKIAIVALYLWGKLKP